MKTEDFKEILTLEQKSQMKSITDVENTETRLCGYPIHPLANINGMREGDSAITFMRDIAENGQRIPITITSDGFIIDGRNRAKVCEILGHELKFEVLPEMTEIELESLVDSLEERRHKTPTQKAIVVAKRKMIMSPRNRKGEVNPKYKATAEKEGVLVKALTAAYYLINTEPRPEKIEALMKEGGTVEVQKYFNKVWVAQRSSDVITVAKDVKRSIEKDRLDYSKEPSSGSFTPESTIRSEDGKKGYTHIMERIESDIPDTFNSFDVKREVAGLINVNTIVSAKYEDSKDLLTAKDYEIKDLRMQLKVMESQLKTAGLKIGTLNGILGNEQI